MWKNQYIGKLKTKLHECVNPKNIFKAREFIATNQVNFNGEY